MAGSSGAGGSAPIGITLEQHALEQVSKQLREEADGNQLQRLLVANLKKAAEPTVRDLKASINATPSRGLPHAGGGSLRQAIASSISSQVALSGDQTGVTLRQAKTALRGFPMAGNVFNKGSFRHKVYGRSVWVTQTGNPGWFDNKIKGRRDEFAKGAAKAVEDLAKLLAERTTTRGH